MEGISMTIERGCNMQDFISPSDCPLLTFIPKFPMVEYLFRCTRAFTATKRKVSEAKVDLIETIPN